MRINHRAGRRPKAEVACVAFLVAILSACEGAREGCDGGPAGPDACGSPAADIYPFDVVTSPSVTEIGVPVRLGWLYRDSPAWLVTSTYVSSWNIQPAGAGAVINNTSRGMWEFTPSALGVVTLTASRYGSEGQGRVEVVENVCDLSDATAVTSGDSAALQLDDASCDFGPNFNTVTTSPVNAATGDPELALRAAGIAVSLTEPTRVRADVSTSGDEAWAFPRFAPFSKRLVGGVGFVAGDLPAGEHAIWFTGGARRSTGSLMVRLRTVERCEGSAPPTDTLSAGDTLEVSLGAESCHTATGEPAVRLLLSVPAGARSRIALTPLEPVAGVSPTILRTDAPFTVGTPLSSGAAQPFDSGHHFLAITAPADLRFRLVVVGCPSDPTAACP